LLLIFILISSFKIKSNQNIYLFQSFLYLLYIPSSHSTNYGKYPLSWLQFPFAGIDNDIFDKYA